MNPYSGLAPHHYWSGHGLYDPSPKWRFDLQSDRFATAGSCFARHISRAIKARGAHFVTAERVHALLSRHEDRHGYGEFSARYGNVYTCRQLRELLEQAFEARPPVFDFFQNAEGRWIDLSRLRAVPGGFTTAEDCRFDRLYHLERVAEIFKEASVFVFTLSLTETWANTEYDHCYPICPSIVGAFDSNKHAFRNYTFSECLDDLRHAIRLVRSANDAIRILLTVSPVMLEATFEKRGVLQSSVASKAILRAVADQVVREFDFVDYFPAFEIITGPQARGQYYNSDLRDVTPEGVEHVMDTFFASRTFGVAQVSAPVAAAAQSAPHEFDPDCDEILLGGKP